MSRSGDGSGGSRRPSFVWSIAFEELLRQFGLFLRDRKQLTRSGQGRSPSLSFTTAMLDSFSSESGALLSHSSSEMTGRVLRGVEDRGVAAVELVDTPMTGRLTAYAGV